MNPAQLEAVNHLHGPCLVLAGAGSGKTRVITHKVARLIEVGMRPSAVMAITFTNKAAAEMRERARGLIGKAANEVIICTFHALGVRLLREDGQALGLSPRRWRFGHLPGDLHFDLFGRHIHIPLTSTLLLSLLVGLLIRWL